MKMDIRWYLIKKTFPIWEKLGVHVTPNHYYEPIPDTRTLSNDIWERESEMKGVNLNTEKQKEFINKYCLRYKKEYESFGLHEPNGDFQYYVYNGWFGEIDGDVLYTILRTYKPRRVIEIGSGYSTILISETLNKNKLQDSINSKFIAIDPYPNPDVEGKIPDNVELIEKKLQEIDFEYFKQLKENDVLFIDSTSVVKINSDVCYEFLELLPRLNSGVIIHVHDIFLPWDYPKEWVIGKKLFSNEEYFLQAFLIFNESFEIIWMGNYMKNKYPDLCKKMFRGQASQSFWMKKIK